MTWGHNQFLFLPQTRQKSTFYRSLSTLALNTTVKLLDRDEARELLSQARKKLKIADPRRPRHGAGDYGDQWWDRLGTEAILAEAEGLIASPKP